MKKTTSTKDPVVIKGVATLMQELRWDVERAIKKHAKNNASAPVPISTGLDPLTGKPLGSLTKAELEMTISAGRHHIDKLRECLTVQIAIVDEAQTLLDRIK